MPEDVTTPTAASKSTKVQAVLKPRFYDFDYETPPAPVAKAKPTRETKSAPVANGLAANRHCSLVLSWITAAPSTSRAG